MFTTTLSLWDYMVFGLIVAASIGIGIYYAVTSGRNQSTTDYLVAGHSMTFLPVALSMIVSYQSSIMMLGTPAEGYMYGIPFLLGEVGMATGTVLEIFLTLNFLGRLELSSPYEYFERRFKSRPLRLLANVLSCMSNLMYMSVVLYGQAIALQAVTGFSVLGSIGITSAAAVVYTAIGGLKAVIWTDVLQFLIMLTGLLASTIQGSMEAGGAIEVWTKAAQTGRLDVSFDPDPTVRHTVWNLFFGRIVTGFGFLISPAMLQRISCTKSFTQARRALSVTVIGMPLLTCIALVEGIVAYGYYSYLRCDPFESNRVDTPNQISPLFIMDIFIQLPGMPGLFLSALFSASLSTISSALSSMASVTWYDVIKPCKPNLSDFRAILLAKATVVAFGVTSGVLAITVSQTRTKTLLQIINTLDALFYSPLIALFYLGALVPSANVKGAIAGLVTGVAFTGWLIIGSMVSSTETHTPYLPSAPTDQCPMYNLSVSLADVNNTVNNSLYRSDHSYAEQDSRAGIEVLYSLSYTLYSIFSILAVLVVGTGVSWATGGWRSRADPDLVIQMTDIQCWCRSRRHGRHDRDHVKHHPTNTPPTPYQQLNNIPPTPHQHPTNTSPTPHQHSTSTSPTPHQHLINTHTHPTLYQHLTNTPPTLHQHLTNTPPTPYQQLTNIPPTLHQHTNNNSPTPHQHLTNTPPTLHQHLHNTSPTSHQHSTSTSPTPHQRPTNNSLTSHQHPTNTQLALHQHPINTPPAHHQHSTSTSPTPHKHPTNTPPAPYQHPTNTPPAPHQHSTSTSPTPHQHSTNAPPAPH